MKGLGEIVKMMKEVECEITRIKGKHKRSNENLLLVVVRGEDNIEDVEKFLDEMSDEVK